MRSTSAPRSAAGLLALGVLATGACGGNGASTTATDRAFTLVYSHDVEGEIEPCG